MSCRGVVFDLDGTLVDTLDDIHEAVRFALQRMEEPPRTRDEVRKMVGEGVEVLCRRTLTRPDPERVERMISLMKAHYRKTPVGTAAPYPGITEMLDDLADEGALLAVLSNKPQEMVDELLDRLFKETRFEMILGRRADLPAKPDPAGALRIAETVGVPPAEWLYVGDSEVDVRTAGNAGMTAAAVTWGFRTAHELRANGALRLLDRPREVVKLFHALNSPPS